MRRLRRRAGRQGRRRFDLGNRGRGAADADVGGCWAPSIVDGVRCLKLEGVQKSDDWDKPRADRTAWRRTDTVWLAPRPRRRLRAWSASSNAASRPTATRLTRACCATNWMSRCSTPAGCTRNGAARSSQAHAFADAAAPLLSDAGQVRAAAHRTDEPDRVSPRSPAANALPRGRPPGQAPRRGGAARRDAAGPRDGRQPDAPPAVAAVGGEAPDFLAPDLVANSTFHLRPALGKPTLLVFYNPASPTAAVVLAYAQQMSDSHKDLSVLTLSMSGDGTRRGSSAPTSS